MANEEHLARLQQGVDAWNRWRDKNPGLELDFSGVNLTEANLRGADLTRVHLIGAHPSETDLREANLTRTHLSEADLHDATIGSTILGNVDLSTARGLETVRHRGPSTIGIDTFISRRATSPRSSFEGLACPTT
jgi:uncharacterized protein YjbI with pentapeptide repeats